jgi:hypothetical protein
MKVLLLRDHSVNSEFVDTVQALLNGISGPLQFVVAPEVINTGLNKVLTWERIFDMVGQFVEQQNEPFDFAFLLTEKRNEYNFFGYLNPKNGRDGFIHAGDWQYFLNCQEYLPVAYHVLALMIQQHIIEREVELVQILHQNPIGCVNDFCKNKKEVILKMRTGDICSKCLERLLRKMPLPIVHQIMELLESLRLKMLFSQNMKQFFKPSSLELTPEYNLLLPDFSRMEIRLRPLEKVLYAIYFSHPEGIYLSDLVDHKLEMIDIYKQVSGLDSRQDIQRNIDELCNVTTNSANEKLSRIKKVLEENLGKRLAENYIIGGNRGEKKRIKILEKQIE